MENFIVFDLIITVLFSFMYLLNLLTQPVTSQLLLNQQFLFCTFLQITSELKETVYYSNRPIGLRFHALSHETTKILLPMSFKKTCQVFVLLFLNHSLIPALWPPTVSTIMSFWLRFRHIFVFAIALN